MMIKVVFETIDRNAALVFLVFKLNIVFLPAFPAVLSTVKVFSKQKTYGIHTLYDVVPQVNLLLPNRISPAPRFKSIACSNLFL
jgi:hypothetical protein